MAGAYATPNGSLAYLKIPLCVGLHIVLLYQDMFSFLVIIYHPERTFEISENDWDFGLLFAKKY